MLLAPGDVGGAHHRSAMIALEAGLATALDNARRRCELSVDPRRRSRFPTSYLELARGGASLALGTDLQRNRQAPNPEGIGRAQVDARAM